MKITTKILKSLERVREAAQEVSDNMRASPSGDEYKFVGSTNDIDELNEALKEYTFLVIAWNTRAALAERQGLIEAARKAAEAFRWYEKLHAAKPDMEKAKRNAEYAEMLEAALEAQREEW